MVNLNGPPHYARNKPIVDMWANTACERFQIFPISAAQRAGVDINASDKVKEAQAQAAARKQVADALQQAQQALKYMEKIPGVSKADIDEAKKEIAKLAQEQKIQVEDKPVDLNAPPPGVDTGGLFSEENYYNYIIIFLFL